MSALLLIGIDAGGTSFKLTCAEDNATNVIKSGEVKTTTPAATIDNVIAWVKQFDKVSSIGIACFGPLALDKTQSNYGYITSTPKPGWKNTNIVGAIQAAFPGVPVGFDTDVNAAAVGEVHNGGHGNSIRTLAYITVGTGVGVGLVVEGNCVHGVIHPELGHMKPPPAPGDAAFVGTCPFHGNCIEGMVSTGALCKRFDVSAPDLPALDDSSAQWDVVAFYLAHLCATITLTVSPQKIVISGGVANRASLFPKIHDMFRQSLNGYLRSDLFLDRASDFIVQSKFGDRAGAIGAVELAHQALKSAAAVDANSK